MSAAPLKKRYIEREIIMPHVVHRILDNPNLTIYEYLRIFGGVSGHVGSNVISNGFCVVAVAVLNSSINFRLLCMYWLTPFLLIMNTPNTLAIIKTTKYSLLKRCKNDAICYLHTVTLSINQDYKRHACKSDFNSGGSWRAYDISYVNAGQ